MQMLTQSRGVTRAAEEEINVISGEIVDAAIEVHKTLGGPGLLERIYEDALFQELKLRNLVVQRQVYVPVKYKEFVMPDPLRLDLLVENTVIIEVKASEHTHPIFKKQVLTYLRLAGLQLGLVLNFGQETILKGVSRVVNGL